MKGKILTILLLLFTIHAYCQEVQSIRFIYYGNELRPVGTLVISVGKLVKPMDKPLDSIFGKSIKTDIRTFETIRKFAKSKTNNATDQKQPADDPSFYRIKDSDGFKMDLYLPSFRKFIQELQSILIKERLDGAIIDELGHH